MWSSRPLIRRYVSAFHPHHHGDHGLSDVRYLALILRRRSPFPSRRLAEPTQGSLHRELSAPGDDLVHSADTLGHLAPRVFDFAAECSDALSSVLGLDQQTVLRHISVDGAVELRAVRRRDSEAPKIVLLPLAQFWAGRCPSQRGNEESLMRSRAGDLRMSTVEPYSLLDCDQVASISGASPAPFASASLGSRNPPPSKP